MLNLIPSNKKITRQELIMLTGLSDREVRNRISELKEQSTILFNANESGYRRPKRIDTCSKEELLKEVDEVNHCINYIRKMKKKYNKQLRTYIAYKKVAEKYL